MDDAESLVPSKKSKIDTNYSLCIICQKDLNKPVIKRPSLQTIKNVISLSNERSNYGDSSVNDFVKLVSNITPTENFELQGFYHKHYYADFGNVEKRNGALLRYEEAIAKKSSEVTSRQPGRPQMDNSKNEQPSSKRTLWSESTTYKRELCIICQQPGGVCRTVAFLQTGQSMLKVAQKLMDKSFYLRLNTIPNADDAVANEVKYHLKCWSSCKQIAAKKDSESIDHEKESYAQTVSDIEIVNLVQSGLNDPSLKILDMNMINGAYRDILLENGLKTMISNRTINVI